MKTGPAGLALIKSFESCVLTPYRDVAGHWTIGWGHLLGDVLPPPYQPGVPIEPAAADALLVADLAQAEGEINGAVHRPLRQHQFDALVSFTFNCGLRHTLIDLVNAGNDEGAVDKMLEYRKAGSPLVTVIGLLRRRCAEAGLYLTA